MLEVLERAYGRDLDVVLVGVVAGAVLVSGTLVLARALLAQRLAGRERQRLPLATRHKVAAAALGGVVGFALGITSIGSGALIAIGLITIFRLVPTRVVGTDVFHAAILLSAAAAGHIVGGNVEYALAGTILLGSVPGAWLGSHLAVRLPTSTLRLALGIVLTGSGLALPSKAGVAVHPAVLAAVPIILIFVLVRRDARQRGRADAIREAPSARSSEAVRAAYGTDCACRDFA